MTTIAGIASADPSNFSTLVAAVTFIDDTLGTDYLGTLSDPTADLTVFAPTNDAFALLAKDLGYVGDAAGVGAFLLSLGADDTATATLLESIVTYHVLPGTQDAAAVDAQASLATLNGATIDVSQFDLTPGHVDTTLIDNDDDALDPTVIVPNQFADNGVVHVIDRVLLPEDFAAIETITGLVTADDGEFDILQAALSAVTSVDLVALFDDPSQDFTVFAPTDAAFIALAKDFGFTGDETDEDAVFGFIAGKLDEISGGDAIGLLTDILNYHVSAGEQLASDIAASGSVHTLLGAPFSATPVTVDGTPTLELGDAEPDTADPIVAIADIQATNGVVHAIDAVLIPADLPELETITGVVTVEDGEFDILQMAVIAADLAGTLDDPSAEFTTFAPTDAAFVGLAQALGYAGDPTDEAAAFGFLGEALTLFSAGEDFVPLLTNILLYHVAAGRLTLQDVAAAGSVETLLEVGPGVFAELTVDGTNLVDGDPDLPDPGLVATDVPATNGIIHVLDGVLIPVDLLASDGSDDVDFIIDGDAGTRIKTGADNDLVDGNGGDDVIHTGDGDDIALGGAGHDVLHGNRGADILKGEEGDDLIRGQKGSDTADGGAGDDFLIGGRGDDDLHGGADDDKLFGGRDRDALSGGEGHDVLFGGRGKDTLEGGDGDDALTGGTGDDLLEGGDGEDNLLGGFGADTLDGGAEDDFLITGFGHDVIIFREGDGHDTVLDFNTSRDQIDISAFGFTDFHDLEDAHVIERGVFSTTLDFGDDEITLVGFTSGIDADNFIF